MIAKAALTRSDRAPSPPAWRHACLVLPGLVRVRAGRALSVMLSSELATQSRRLLCILADASVRIDDAIHSWRVPRAACIALRIGGCALATGIAALAFFNNRSSELASIGPIDGSTTQLSQNETVVVRHERLPNSYVDNEGDIAVDESEEDAVYPRTVQTVRFLNPN